MAAMAHDTEKMEFSNIINSILSLFEMRDNYTWNFTDHIVARMEKNRTVGLLEMYQMVVWQITGKRSDFHAWLSLELEKFFTEFAQNFSTGDGKVDRLRGKIHELYSKECKYKKFRRDLTYHIFTEFFKRYNEKLRSEFVFPHDGRNALLKIITDFIHDLYCL